MCIVNPEVVMPRQQQDTPPVRLKENWQDDMPVDPNDAVEREERKHHSDSDYDEEARHSPPHVRPPHDNDGSTEQA